MYSSAALNSLQFLMVVPTQRQSHAGTRMVLAFPGLGQPTFVAEVGFFRNYCVSRSNARQHVSARPAKALSYRPLRTRGRGDSLVSMCCGGASRVPDSSIIGTLWWLQWSGLVTVIAGLSIQTRRITVGLCSHALPNVHVQQ